MMKTTMKQRERKNMIIVLEGVKASSRDEKGVAPLSWAMRHVVNVNHLLVLNILNLSLSDAGFRSIRDQQSDIRDREGYLKFLHEEIGQRREPLRKNLRPYYDICKINGVKFEAKVAAGFQPKRIVKTEANNVRATWIVLDRSWVEATKRNICRTRRTIVLVNDYEEAEILPPAGEGLRIPIIRKENPNPKSPQLLRESVLQEEPHIRDSLPVPMSKDRESEVHTPSMSNRLDIPSFKSETPKPISPKLLKESLSREEPHIRDSLPCFKPSLETMCCEKDIFTEPSLERTNEYVTVPKTRELDIIAWRRNLDPTHLLKLPIELSWNKILAITDEFQHCLCMPGHEHLEMYKGHLHDLEVIVKRFPGDCSRLVEAEKRVSSSMAHRNFLVPIYYHESSYGSALVYPSSGNGTLNQYLCGNSARLTCHERMKIAIGIGHGLRYMHEECPGGPIVHGDLRPCNIVLGHNHEPLISGFGRTRWLEMKCCHEAPSDHDSILLIKSDVLAFGVLLLRLFCQQRMLEDDAELVDWAQPLLVQGAYPELLDQDMEDLDMYVMYRVMSAATQCTKPDNPVSRPSMTRVLSILKGESSCVMQSSPSSESSLTNQQFL